jgi:oxaloacetate decarboxylase alpha subunit
MNLKDLRELIEIVASEPTIEEFEFERSGVRVRIRMGADGQTRGLPALPSPAVQNAESPPATDRKESAPEGADLYEIPSPMVGTFYRASTPDAEPFVKVGDTVEKGTVVCIIEAMKLMNEIESDVAGEVVSIRAENGQPVEYGDALIVVRPR